MKINRRDFIKISGAAATAAALGFDIGPIQAATARLAIKTQNAKETSTICPYCAVGCGLIVSSSQGQVVNTEGDPDHPINRGALCAKGAGLYQVAVNENRLTNPLYRAPGSSQWEEKSWDWTIKTIAARVKKTRDENFIAKDEKGRLVNRVEAIAHVGSAALDNEECWTLQAMMRALGLVYIEHQARI